MRTRVCTFFVLVLSVVLFVVVALPDVCFAQTSPAPDVDYQRPVPGRILDPFRPPTRRYGAANRGVEFATTPGQPVLAAADGVVSFAGEVGGELHVVVLHRDGVRTSYSFVATIEVARGQKVKRGQMVATAKDTVHIGARYGVSPNDVYIDPLVLFDATTTTHVRLVPNKSTDMGTPEQERGGLLRSLINGGAYLSHLAINGATLTQGEVLRQLQGMQQRMFLLGAQYGLEFRRQIPYILATYQRIARDVLENSGVVGYLTLDVVDTTSDLIAAIPDQGECTAADTDATQVLARHLVVLVGGLGSASDNASMFEMNTPALGIAAQDTFRFSYAGGSTKDNAYTSQDTTQSIETSGRRLELFLQQLRASHPGVPIDVVAHSQGGVVAQYALTQPGANELGINSLTTLSAPHEGAPIADARVRANTSLAGRFLVSGIAAVPGVDFETNSESVKELASTSSFMSDLAKRTFPDGIYVSSIGARGDLIVPPTQTDIPGEHHTTVTLSNPGIKAHDALPKSPQALREVMLAINRKPPTCRDRGSRFGDVALAGLTRAGERTGIAGVVAAR